MMGYFICYLFQIETRVEYEHVFGGNMRKGVMIGRILRNYAGN